MTTDAETLASKGPKWPKWDKNWDLREPEKRSEEDKGRSDENNNVAGGERVGKMPTATRNIILIRHGQYNLDGKTDSERYLTPLGREQAKLTGFRLAELKLPYTYLLHSNMSRAMETSQLISQNLPHVPVLPADGILREGAPITPEPRVGSWKPEHYYQQDGARIEAAFRKHFHRAGLDQVEDSYEIVVCHANVIRYFVCRALQLPPEAWLRLSLKHASLTWLVFRPSGSVHTKCIGEAGHLPQDMLTTS